MPEEPKTSRILFVVIGFALLAAIAPLAFWLAGNLVGFLIIGAWVALVGFLASRRSVSR